MTERTMAEAFDEALVSQTTRQIGALPVVYPILETLGLREIVNGLRYTRADIDLGHIAELLTLNRLLAPQPLCWVKRWASDTVLPEVLDAPVGKLYDNRLGRALDALHPFLGEIWASIAARAVTVYQVDLSIVHWDITSFFFEGEYTPYQGVLRTITFQLDDRAVTDRALVVWSAGKARLDSQKNRTYLKRLLNGLARIRGWMGKRRYTNRDYIVRCIDGVQRGNPARGWVDVEITTAEDGRLGLKFRINQERLAEARVLEGKYVLATNAPHLSADDILCIYEGQDKVEKANRTVKGPLRVRPVFVRTDERIEGLVSFTMLALLVRSILALQCRRAGLSFTVDQVLAECANLRAIDSSFSDDSCRRVASDLSVTQEQILMALNLPSVTRYVTLPSRRR